MYYKNTILMRQGIGAGQWGKICYTYGQLFTPHIMQRKVLYLGVFIWIMVLSIGAVFAAPFSDTASTDWWAEAAVDLQEQGILSGYADGSFRPASPINRAEFTKLLVEALSEKRQWSLVEGSTVFTDVRDSDWFSSYVALVYKQGIIEGYMDNTFRPGVSINRAEAAAILVRALELEMSPSTTSSFDDLPITAWYRAPLLQLHKAGLVTGVSARRMAPEQLLTRAEAAVLFHRVLAYMSVEEDMTEDPIDSGSGSVITPEEEEEVAVDMYSQVVVAAHDLGITDMAIPYGATNVPFLRMTLQVQDAPVFLYGFQASREGVGDPEDFTSITVHLNNQRIGNAQSINRSTNVVTFDFSTRPVEIPVGVYTFELRGNMANNQSGNVGGEHRFSIEGAAAWELRDAEGGEVDVSMTTALQGALHSVLAIEAGALEVSKGITPSTALYAGQTQVPLAEIRFSAAGKEDVLLRSLRLEQVGTIKSDELANLRLYDVETQAVLTDPADVASNDHVFFDLSLLGDGGYVIPQGSTKRLMVYGDIVGGSKRTISFSLDLASDVDAVGLTYGVGVPVSYESFEQGRMVEDMLDMPVAFLSQDYEYDGVRTSLGRIAVDTRDGPVSFSLRFSDRTYTSRAQRSGFPFLEDVCLYGDNNTSRCSRGDLKTDGSQVFSFTFSGSEQGVYEIVSQDDALEGQRGYIGVELMSNNRQHLVILDVESPVEVRFLGPYGAQHQLPAVMGDYSFRNTADASIILEEVSFLQSPFADREATVSFALSGSDDARARVEGPGVVFTPQRVLHPSETVFGRASVGATTPTVTPFALLLNGADSVVYDYTDRHALGTGELYNTFGSRIFSSPPAESDVSRQLSLPSSAQYVDRITIAGAEEPLMLRQLQLSLVDLAVAPYVDRIYLLRDGVLLASGRSMSGLGDVVWNFPVPVEIAADGTLYLDLYVQLRDSTSLGTPTGDLALYVSDADILGNSGSRYTTWRSGGQGLVVSHAAFTTPTEMQLPGSPDIKVGDILILQEGSSSETALVRGVRTTQVVEGDTVGLALGAARLQRGVADTPVLSTPQVVRYFEGVRTELDQLRSAPFLIYEDASWSPQRVGAPLPNTDLWRFTVQSGTYESTASVDTRLYKVRINVSGNVSASNFRLISRRSGKVIATASQVHGGGGATFVTFDLSGAAAEEVLMAPGRSRTYAVRADVTATGISQAAPGLLTLSIANLGGPQAQTFGVDSDVWWQDINNTANGGAGRVVDVFWIDMEDDRLEMSEANQYTASN